MEVVEEGVGLPPMETLVFLQEVGVVEEEEVEFLPVTFLGVELHLEVVEEVVEEVELWYLEEELLHLYRLVGKGH